MIDLELADLERFDGRAPAGRVERRFCCPNCGGDKPLDAAHRSPTQHEDGRMALSPLRRVGQVARLVRGSANADPCAEIESRSGGCDRGARPGGQCGEDLDRRPCGCPCACPCC
jgi:hypothetical protein